MNKMLRKYYANLRNNHRYSLVLEDDSQKKRKKRTKSMNTFNNITNTSEKSIQRKKSLKRVGGVGSVSKAKPKKHKSQNSYVPKVFKLKTKPSPAKTRKTLKHKSVSDIDLTLSESYDSLINHFDCDMELRKSLKQLVTLEKNALKRKFNSKSRISSNSIFFNSYHNSRI